MNLLFVVGLVAGMGNLIAGILWGGGSVMLFYDVPSIFITFGGSFCAMLVAYPFNRLKKVKDLFLICLKDEKYNYTDLILTLVSLSEKSRREGLLSLEDTISELEDPFMKTGLQLIVDGTDPEIVRNVLETDVEQMMARHDANKRMFDDWAGLAPAFGMIGTLMGLVMMLVNLADKSKIGPNLAIAIITTFYGAVLAYLMFTPMGTRLDQKTGEEALMKSIIVVGILSIQAGENPRIVKDKLIMYLPPVERDAISREVEK